MKRREMIYTLGLASAIPFLPWDIKGKVVESPVTYNISGESITINRSGKYVLRVSVIFEDMGIYGISKGYILIKRKNEKIVDVVTLFNYKAGRESEITRCNDIKVLDLKINDIVSFHMKPKYLNILKCYINSIMLSSN